MDYLVITQGYYDNNDDVQGGRCKMIYNCNQYIIKNKMYI